MAGINQKIKEKKSSCSVSIHNPGYMADHVFQGKPVLPAVEAMEVLARQARQIIPENQITTIVNARFDKFLFVDPDREEISAVVEFESTDTGDLNTSLLTRTTSPKLGITRTKIHATATFLKINPAPVPLHMDVAALPEGILTPVSSVDIYRELVPFGPAYQNLIEKIWLSPDGVLATIRCPKEDTINFRLGSPFTLDAAFHAACVWAQYYQKIVAFPVGIDKRQVISPTQPNQCYFARIFPRKTDSDLLEFDVWLFNEDGEVCEFVRGVQMRDVSGGRLKPPDWFVKLEKEDSFEHLKWSCKELMVIELDAVAPYAKNALTTMETDRYNSLGEKRKRSYLAARLALKCLFRSQFEEEQGPAHQIETYRPDTQKPTCFQGENELTYCSVSHDARFAVAVTDDKPVGVDVEEISEKAVRISRLYMSENEQQLVEKSPLGQAEAAVRVWSIKEAVAKATGVVLADVWQQVKVDVIGNTESNFTILERGKYSSLHATVDDHIFTVVRIK